MSTDKPIELPVSPGEGNADIVREWFARHPQAMLPVYSVDAAIRQIILHHGAITLEAGGVVLKGTGDIVWDMVRPSSLFSVAHFDGCADASGQLVGGELEVAGTVTFLDLPGTPKVANGIFAPALWEGSTSTSPERINDGVRFGQNVMVSKVMFHVMNLPAFSGFYVNRSSDGTISAEAGRLRCEVGEVWRVALDRVPDSKAAYADLEGYRGVTITHVGMIERKDGTDFTLADVEDSLMRLGYGLSFCGGQWCLPFLLVGLGATGEQLSFSWRAPRTSNWSEIPTWYPSLNEYALQEFMAGFSSLLQDSRWEYPVRVAINWYLQALNPDTLDTGIVLAHTALEILAYTLAVEAPRSGASKVPGTYNRLPADEKVGDFLTSLGVTTSVPSGMTSLTNLVPICYEELSKKRRDEVTIDGPHLLNYVRNAVIHGNRLSQLLTFSPDLRLEAWRLGLWYLEVSLLKLCGYAGTYVSRISASKWPEEVPLP